MTPKRYLSTKKTEKQTISISPELRNEIEELRRERANNEPENPNYCSISSFYTSIMENMLKFLEEGNEIKELYKYPDNKVKTYFDDFSFKVFAPIYDIFLEANRYSSLDLKSTAFFLLSTRKIYIQYLNPYDLNKIKQIFQKFRKYFIQKKITRSFKFTLKTQKGQKNFHSIFELSTYFKNITFENIKYNALFLGFLGIKVNNIRFPKDATYSRMELETTDLFFNPKSMRTKRMNLSKQNLKKLINFKLILMDQNFYTWVKLAVDKEISISFRDFSDLEDLLDKMGLFSNNEDLMDDILLKRLQFFEKLHWIKINNTHEHSFSIVIPKKDNKNEIEFMVQFLEQFSSVSKMGENYYLE